MGGSLVNKYMTVPLKKLERLKMPDLFEIEIVNRSSSLLALPMTRAKLTV